MQPHTDRDWLSAWFDEQDARSAADDDGTPEPPDGDGASPPTARPLVRASGARREEEPERATDRRRGRIVLVAFAVAVALAAAGLVVTGTRPDGAVAAPGQRDGVGFGSATPSPAQAAAAELAVHRLVTTTDGRRWVDAARTVGLAEVAGAGPVVVVDSIVLDGAPGAAPDEHRWVGRRPARYVVPLTCAPICAAVGPVWPVAPDARPRAAADAGAALVVAGYEQVAVTSRQPVADRVTQITADAVPPGGDDVERIVAWVTADETGGWTTAGLDLHPERR